MSSDGIDVDVGVSTGSALAGEDRETDSETSSALAFSRRSFSSARSIKFAFNAAIAFSTPPRSRSPERLRDFLRLLGATVRLARRSRSNGSVMISVSRSVARLLDRRDRTPFDPLAPKEPLASELCRRGDASRGGKFVEPIRGEGLALVDGTGEGAAEEERLVITGRLSLP